MAKDPAFLFYPGDYLKDTQCISEKTQVAYDRIMCEHMRNICITQEQLNFFTKRLSEDEKMEIMFLLTKIKGGYQIGWVAESISKRRSYSESRSVNRKGKTKEHVKTYDNHMEIAIVNENIIDNILWTSIKKNFLEDGPWQFKFVTEKKISLEKLLYLQKEFINDIELKEDFKILKELKSHFTNWYNLKEKNSLKIGFKKEQSSAAPLKHSSNV